jgi:ribosome maturation factor RimP
VELTLSDGSQLTGRVGALTDGDKSVSLVVREGARANFSVRELPLGGIVKAVVQVEFSPPSQRELELTGQSAEEAGA